MQVHPLFIASIFVMAMAMPAFVAVKYVVKPKQEPVPVPPGSRPFPGSTQASAAQPVRGLAPVPARVGPKLLVANKKAQAIEVDQQVDDTIRRLILLN